MARVRKKNMKLEKEFMKQVEIHKISIVKAGFLLFGNDIYEQNFTKNMPDNLMENTAQFVFDLYSTDFETFNKLYEYCWKRISKVLPDGQIY